MKNTDKLLRFESDEQALDFARRYTVPGATVPQDEEIPGLVTLYIKAVAMQRLKLAGAVWFDGAYPCLPGKTINVMLPADPETDPVVEESIRYTMKKYKGATRSELIALCRGLTKPAWAE